MFPRLSRKNKIISWGAVLVLIGALSFLAIYNHSAFSATSLTKPAASWSDLNLKTKVDNLEKEVNLLKKSLAEKKGESPEGVPSIEEQKIKVIQQALPSVVSIIASKKVPVYSSFFSFPGFSFGEPIGEEEKEVSSGTGFLISEDGMILTNKHVVADAEATYKVITNDNKEYPATVLAKDPFQDLALVKIKGSGFRPLKLGDSSNLTLGETAICIGNALGEFRNSVSVGVISGLSRRINATGGGAIETLNGIIQTDAAINPGNSGGPLLNLQGEVIGINVAMAQGAENIGFAIPINQAKRDIKQVKQIGKIVYPFLGIRYTIVDKALQEQSHLPVDYGALIVRGKEPGEVAVEPGSAAAKMGLKENDIILKINGQKIDKDHLLGDLIKEYQPGDKITLEVLRGQKHLILSGKLGKRES